MKKKTHLQKLIDKYKSKQFYWKRYEEMIIDETREAIWKDIAEIKFDPQDTILDAYKKCEEIIKIK